MTLTRSRSQAISQLHPNKEIASALHSILPLLEQHQLQWHDIGRNPDCQFTSFIHASEEKVPEQEQIIQVRRAVRNWLLAHQLSSVDTVTEWQQRVMAFGFATELRKQGNEHSLCAMAACFTTRINLITVSTSGHHTQAYCPPDNIQPTKEIWMLYMNLEHTRHTYPRLRSRTWPLHYSFPLLPLGGVQTVQWLGLGERQPLRRRQMVILLQYDLDHGSSLQLPLH